MYQLLNTFLLLQIAKSTSPCNFNNIFGAGPPPYYINYKLQTNQTITIDGNLNDPAWKEVAFTDSNPDICGTQEYCNTNGNCATGPDTCAVPRFTTRQKMRWDDNYLYIGAYLEETQIWANNTKHDSVIFYDNDYEVFISPDGSNHYYKEYEMNARATWWDLSLNKPYSNGGYENSSRVFGKKGWDDPGLVTAAQIHGCTLNDPSSGPCQGWSVEIKFPLKTISLNNTNTLPIKPNSYWRINFSRVEYKVNVIDNNYVKDQTPCENWLWAPLGIVDVHQPERWGYIQFSNQAVNSTFKITDPDWQIRSVAMQLYYAQHHYYSQHNHTYTTNVTDLYSYIPLGEEILTCSELPTITTQPGKFVVQVMDLKTQRIASVTEDRYLLVLNSK